MKKISFNDYVPEQLVDNESCRLVTTEQYQEYQQLKEEHKPLSWNQLKEEAKKMGAEIMCKGNTSCEGINIDDNVYLITKLCLLTDGIETIHIKAKSYDQMLAIMKALQ